MFRLLKKITAVMSLGTVLMTGSAISANAMDVYLFRGLAGVPFSVGLDDLEDKITASGIHAETWPYGAWHQVYSKILRRGVKEVALVGHSMGALSALSLTEKLKKSGIRVVYLGLIDIPGTKKTPPRNASWSEAYLSGQPGFSLLRHNPRDQNLVVNTRVSRTVHITIDDSTRVHDAIISAVWLADASIHQSAKTATAYAANTKTRASNAGLDLMMTGSVKK